MTHLRYFADFFPVKFFKHMLELIKMYKLLYKLVTNLSQV